MDRKESNRRYRHSKRGLIRRCYYLMKRRVQGGNVRNPELYVGLELLSKLDFIIWSQNNIELQRLYENWIVNSFDTRFTPSVDRIDSNQGYVLTNMRWVTHAENSRLAAQKRYA